MRSNKSYFLMCWLTMLVVSCSSPLKSELMSNESIQFEGFVTPIRIPIKLEYKPAAGEFEAEIILVVKVKDEETVSSSGLEGHFEISRLGDKLLWDYKMTKIKTGNKVYSPKNPIVDARLLIDSIGKIIEFELALPGVDRSKIGDVKYYEIYNEMEKAIKGWTKYFPEKPVKSGGLILITSSKQIAEALEAIDIRLKPDSSIKGIRDVNLIIDGWVYFKGKKALLVSVNDELYIEYPKYDRKIKFKISGYNILDSNSFQNIRAKIKMVFQDNEDGVYLLMDYSAMLK